jgi:hypothetical protein
MVRSKELLLLCLCAGAVLVMCTIQARALVSRSTRRRTQRFGLRRLGLIHLSGASILAVGVLVIPVAISAASSIGAVSVSISPDIAGATSTYDIAFKTTSALPGGSGSITVDASVGAASTVFPSSASSYSIADSTHSTGTGVVGLSPTFSTGFSTVTIVVPRAIDAGDSLTLTIQGVTNPAFASTKHTLSVHTSVDATAVTSSPYTVAASPVALSPVSGTF